MFNQIHYHRAIYQNTGEDYSDDDSTEKVLKKNKRAALVAKWNEQSEQLQSTGSHIYVLSLETTRHDGDGRTALEVVGAYNSKAAAVAKSVTVATIYGRFDSAIKDMFSEYDGGHADNRENRPCFTNAPLQEYNQNHRTKRSEPWKRMALTQKPILERRES